MYSLHGEKSETKGGYFMKVHFITPYSSEKNLGKAYNEAMDLIPDGDSACIRDIDTLFLTPEQPAIIEQYANEHPNAVLTCYLNRCSPLSRMQLLGETVSEERDILQHIGLAVHQQDRHKITRSATEINRDISGTLMVVPKSVWMKVPFPDNGKCLGVDTTFGRQIRAAGIKILRMNAVYLFHTYRLANGVHDKRHLV
jgi:hypothetical protein